ncbi:MAG: glycosyltransferase family 4 protein [Clostridiaceae bacterium]|nr:glycosyltransferase family 4 protein [Clostridiaceae bacterium]
MIIGQFNDSFPPITDGVASVTLNYAQQTGRLLGPDGKSYVVTPSFPKFTDDYDSIEVLRYYSLPVLFRPPYRLGAPKLDLCFQRRLNEIPFDIVHAQCPFGSAKLAQRIARRRDIPMVASFHSKYYDDILAAARSKTISKWILNYLMQTYHNATEVWTVNDNTIATLREYGYEGPVRVINNGTDMARTSPDNRRGPAARAVAEELGLAEDQRLLFFIGQHIWQKNLKLMLESLAILKKRLQEDEPGRKPFQMIFVGSGDAADDLKEMCRKLDIADEVRFLGVIRDRVKIKGFYERADLFLFPSLYDTSALSIREAASSLCPTVMIEGSTTAEGIRDADNGYLSANTPEAYADRVYRALADPEERLRVGISAQESLYRTWETVGAEVLEEYKRLIAEHKKRS